MPPFVKSAGIGSYLCAHHLLLSHARVYHLYQKKYKATQKGKVGIVLNAGGGLMKSNTTTAREAVERKHEFTVSKHFSFNVTLKTFPFVSLAGLHTQSSQRKATIPLS